MVVVGTDGVERSLLVEEYPEGIIGPFCPGHAYLLDFQHGWVRHVIPRDVDIYGEFVRDCKYCLHPDRYDPPPYAPLPKDAQP